VSIPRDLEFLFEAPPVVGNESIECYNALLGQIANRVKPQDCLEWLWIKDYVDLAWEILRYRRAKKHILDFACGSALPSIVKSITTDFSEHLICEHWLDRWFSTDRGRVKVFLEQHGLSLDALVGQAMLRHLDDLAKIESMLALAERSRDAVLREIEQHRDFARRVLGAQAEIVDGEFAEAPLTLAANAAAPVTN
jgi:hypothetical protein